MFLTQQQQHGCRTVVARLLDKGIDHGLTATSGEVQGRIGAVPLTEHDCLTILVRLLDKGIDHGLTATSGELQGRIGPVPLIEHESHLSSNGAVGWKA